MRSLRSHGAPLVLIAALVTLGCDRKPKAPAAAPSLSEGLTHTSLEVRTTPPGAAVRIDGEAQAGTTPLKLQLSTGREHEIEASLEGHLPARQKVFAAPHEPLTLDLVLPQGASIMVASKPEGATARVDGGKPFVTPGKSEALPAGKHLVEVSLPGHVVERHEIVIDDASEKQVSVVLVPGSEVAVRTMPEGARIYVDRRDTGRVSPAVVLVEAGKPHVLEVRLEGHGVQRRRFGAKGTGERIDLSFRLEKSTAIDLRRRIAELQAELAPIEKQMEQLRAKQSGLVVEGSAAAELKLERAIEALEKRATELQVEIDSLQDEVSGLEDQPH